MAQRLFGGQFGVGHEVLVRHRTHQQVAQETQHQQAGEDVQGDVVSRRTLDADAQLIFTQIIHQHRTEHTGSSPRRQQTTVNRTDHLRTEQVRQIRRNSRETTAIHRQDDAERRHEQRDAAQVTQVRNQSVQGKAQGEEHEVSVFAAQVIRERSPEEAPADVEQAEQTGEAGSDGGDRSQLRSVELAERQVIAQQLASEHFLQQRRRHAEDADTGRYVQTQHQPHQTELRRFPGHIHVNMTMSNHRVGGFFRRGGPAFRLPAGWRDAVGQRATDHEHKVDRGHDQEALPHADAGWRSEMPHQRRRQRSADHCAAAKAHDRHAGRHAALVREPFDQGRHRRNVAQAQADTANDPGADPHQPDLVGIHPQRRNQQATTPAQCRYDTGLARSGMFQPATPDGGRATQEDEEQGVDPAEHRDRPVTLGRKDLCDKTHVRCAGHWSGDAQRLGQRQPEHRKTVGHADAQVDGQRGRWHQPTVETGLGDDPLLGQERRLVGAEAVRRDARGHCVSPNYLYGSPATVHSRPLCTQA
ncbi:hypothetical protein D3C81_777040 [compost metagenome]